MSHSRAFLDSLRVGTPVEFFIEASSAWVCGTVAGKRRGTRGPYSYIDVDIRPHRDAPVAIRVFDDDTDEAVSVLLVPRGERRVCGWLPAVSHLHVFVFRYLFIVTISAYSFRAVALAAASAQCGSYSACIRCDNAARCAAANRTRRATIINSQ